MGASYSLATSASKSFGVSQQSPSNYAGSSPLLAIKSVPKSLSKSRVTSPSMPLAAGNVHLLSPSRNAPTPQNSPQQTTRVSLLSSPVFVPSTEKDTRLGKFLATNIVSSRRSLGPEQNRKLQMQTRRARSFAPDGLSLNNDRIPTDISPERLHQILSSSMLNSSKFNCSKNTTACSPTSRNSSILDFSEVSTPNITRDRFISPLGTPKYSEADAMLLESVSTRREPSTPDNFTYTSSLSINNSPSSTSRKSFSSLAPKSPLADYSNVYGMKHLLNTPKTPNVDYREVRGVKHLLRTHNSPKNSLLNVSGVKNMIQKRSPLSNYTNVENIKRLFTSNRRVSLSDSTLESLSQLVKSPDLHIHEVLNFVKNTSPAKNASPSKSPSPKVCATGVFKRVLEEETESVQRSTRGRRAINNTTTTSAKLLKLSSPVRSTNKTVTPLKSLSTQVEGQITPKSPINTPVRITRGRLVKKVEMPSSVGKISPSPKLTRRGRSQKTAALSPKVTKTSRRGKAAPVESVTPQVLEQPGTPTSVPSPKIVRRGRKATVATPTVPAESTKVIAKRNKKVAFSSPAMSISSPQVDDAFPKVTRRGRKTAPGLKVSPKVNTPSPKLTRGRTVSMKAGSPAVISPQTTSPVKRGRAAKSSKVAVDSPVKIVTPKSPVKRATRGRKPKVISIPEKKTATPVEHESPVKKVTPKKTRGRGAAAKKTASSPVARASPQKTTRSKKIDITTPAKSPVT